MDRPTAKQEPQEPRAAKKRRTESPLRDLHDTAACDLQILELTKLVHQLQRTSHGTLGGLSRTVGALMSENRTLKQLLQDLVWRCELARTDAANAAGPGPGFRLRLQKEKPLGPGLFSRRYERLVRRVETLDRGFEERRVVGSRG